MPSVEALLDSLEKWCLEQRERLVRVNEMMKAGTMRSGSSKDGYTWVDETQERIIETDRQIAELDLTLSDKASRKG